MRRLENNNKKEEMEAQFKKMSDEAKFFKEKIKYYEGKQSLKAVNMKNQYEAIKKIEN